MDSGAHRELGDEKLIRLLEAGIFVWLLSVVFSTTVSPGFKIVLGYDQYSVNIYWWKCLLF